MAKIDSSVSLRGPASFNETNEVGGQIPTDPDFTTMRVGDVAQGNFTGFAADGTMEAKGDATCWDDLRVPVSATEVNGSNPPVDALFKNDGTFIPGTSYALSFLSNAQGNLDLPDNVNFDTSSDFTFEFWLRPVVGTQNNIECIRKDSVFELDFVGSNQLNLSFSGVGGATGSLQFNRGGWNHIAIQYDSTNAEILMYLNNNLNITINAATAPADNTEDFVFNRRETLFDVDYIAYWDKTLTPSEISARYAAGVGAQLVGNEVGLKGLWELNDGTGTTAVEKTGLATAGAISGGSEGSQWDWIAGHVGNASPGSRGVILKYFSPTVTNELYFTAQLPHAYKEGSDIFAHVHWVSNAAGGVGERVRWGLEYTWANIGDSFGDTMVLFKEDNLYSEDLIKDKQYITDFGDITGTGKKISSMLVCRVFRDAENVLDTYSDFAALLEIDFHYEVNTLGSRQEFIK